MSERRSTEIKFRTTPSFKARVQAAAAAADKSMSEYLEECAETRMWADANQKLDSFGGIQKFIALANADHPASTVELVDEVNRKMFGGAPQPDAVSTSGSPEPKGWMFEARQ